MNLNLLDYTFAIMDSEERSLEFGIIYHFRMRLPHKMVEAGANKCLKMYPKAACCIKGNKWVPLPGPFKVEEFEVKDEEERKELIHKLISTKVNIKKERLIKQYLINCGNECSLYTQVHHALADGASSAFWLQGMLGTYTKPSEGEIVLKSMKNHEKLTKYRFDTVSDYFTPEFQKPISGEKRIVSFSFPPPKIDSKEYTYNDFLMACIFKALKKWDPRLQKTSIWIPVSIRENPYIGFGNGSSRVRIYDHSKPKESVIELAKNIREQMIWNKKHGTWVIPVSTFLVKILSLWPFSWLFKKYLSSPKLDFSTTIFSHLEFLQDDEELYKMSKGLEVINLLHQRIPISMFAIGFIGKTNFTITYDGELYSENKILQLKQSLTEIVEESLKNL